MAPGTENSVTLEDPFFEGRMRFARQRADLMAEILREKLRAKTEDSALDTALGLIRDKNPTDAGWIGNIVKFADWYGRAGFKENSCVFRDMSDPDVSSEISEIKLPEAGRHFYEIAYGDDHIVLSVIGPDPKTGVVTRTILMEASSTKGRYSITSLKRNEIGAMYPTGNRPKVVRQEGTVARSDLQL